MVNARFVKPLDRDLILPLVQNIGLVITVEENVVQGGFGSAILELINDNGVVNVGVKRLGIDDAFVEHGPQRALRNKYHVDAAAIIETARTMMEA